MATAEMATCPVVSFDEAEPRVEQQARATDGADAGRVAGFDVLRIAAISAIVWFHTGAPGSEYMVWRLPALTMISSMLASSRPQRRSVVEQARRSASRLLVPWLFWCSIYGVVELLDYLRKGEWIVDDLGPYVLLSGTSVHLWF